MAVVAETFEDVLDEGAEIVEEEVRITDAANRLALREEVDIADVEASGKGGYIVLRDIELAIVNRRNLDVYDENTPAERRDPRLDRWNCPVEECNTRYHYKHATWQIKAKNHMRRFHTLSW